MHNPMPRRRFLARGAAIVGGLVGSLAGRGVLAGAQGQQIPYYKLSPCGRAGILSKLQITTAGYRQNNGRNRLPNCQACHACHSHDYYKVMSSKDAANQNRAHIGCNCSVYLAGTLDATKWNQLFRMQAVVDQRWSWVQGILNGQHL